jgi:hypothetical protein
MKKIRLDVEELELESFPTERLPEETGTVVGYWSFVDTTCSDTVWEAGCSFVTATLECVPTEGAYTWCQTEI